MTDIERQHLEAPPPRPSQAAPRVAGVRRRRAALHGEDAPSAASRARKAFLEALREAVGTKTAERRGHRAAAAIYVEIRIAEGADAESDAVLDDTSAILDATEQTFRGAGLGLPLQTGSAIIGARVLSDDAATAAAERAEVVALATALADELAARAYGASPTCTSTSPSTSAGASVKDSAEAPGGKEIIGGEIMSTADWAPQENVEGVHLTAAAAADRRASASRATLSGSRRSAASAMAAIDHAHHRLAGDPTGRQRGQRRPRRARAAAAAPAGGQQRAGQRGQRQRRPA